MTRVWQILLVVLLLANSVGFGFVYWRINNLASQFPFELLHSSVKTQAEISAKLNNLQGLISSTSSRNADSTILGIADLLPDKVNNPTSAPTTFISVSKSVSQPVEVYKEQAEFSAVMGQLVPEYKYPYFTKMNDWYLVSLTDGKTGWVKAAAVSEVL